MKSRKKVVSKEDNFIAPARRAFSRVAKRLRAENKRLNLPLVVGDKGRLRLIKISL
jgi:hypothetical protein